MQITFISTADSIDSSKCVDQIYVVSCILYTVSCILYPVFCILYPLPFILYLVSYIQYSVFFILYSVFDMLYPLSWILYPVSCILYSVSFIIYPLFCILYPVSCTKYKADVRFFWTKDRPLNTIIQSQSIVKGCTLSTQILSLSSRLKLIWVTVLQLIFSLVMKLMWRRRVWITDWFYFIESSTESVYTTVVFTVHSIAPSGSFIHASKQDIHRSSCPYFQTER